MPRSGRFLAAVGGALVALAVVGVLSLAGVFDADEGRTAHLPSVPDAGAQDHDLWTNRVYDQARPAVAFIQARVVAEQQSPFGLPQRRQGMSTGTGFLIDSDGTIVTNAHVVENARGVQVSIAGKELVPARITGSSISDDLALLKVGPDAVKDVRPLAFKATKDVDVGDPVAALGNPLGLEYTITAGIVSAKQRRITAPNGFTIDGVIQTDAAVNPGNSGGPLLDDRGRVVGINSQIATAPTDAGVRAEGFIGIAFAIPSDTARRVIPDLKDDGKVEKPYLGVSTVTVTREVSRALDLGVDRGALVVAVEEGSPADRAGLRAPRGDQPPGAIAPGGDVIVGVDRTDVAGSEDLGAAIGRHKPGDRVEVRYVRDGKEASVDVTLAARPASGG